MARRIGIYSGTFDPIHSGHIAFAEETMRICALDEVIFLPEQKPRGKEKVTNIAHRIALIKQAIQHHTSVRVVKIASEQFTVSRTLPELRQIFTDSDLTFLVGSDVAHTFSYRWDGLGVLLREVSLAIGLRTGDDPNEITALMDKLAQDYTIQINYTFISTHESAITSSQIRNGTADLSQLYPGMLDYIQKHQLYWQA